MNSKKIMKTLVVAFTIGLLMLFSCQSAPKETVSVHGEKMASASQEDTIVQEHHYLQKTIAPDRFSSKGNIEAENIVPVYSRITEQITGLDVEMGERVKKGQVVVRLDETAIRSTLLRCQAELEQAEFQYQAILMGQGFKKSELETAPEEIKRLARINSGYNSAKAALKEVELQLSYCTIAAPISGAVSKVDATLYGAANPGVSLFYIVDTEHLKVCFEVLENELGKFQKGTEVEVVAIAYPAEMHIGTVTAISPSIEKNGMVHLEASLPSHPHLMPGMTAIVTLK